MNSETHRTEETAVGSKSCCCPGGCGTAIERRDFLKLVTLGAAGAATVLNPSLQAMAGPFEASDFEKLIPADKKLSPAWVKSLFERGEKTVYRGDSLAKIGMPIGGLCTGQLYLGGDGKLWHWDIFNQIQRTGDQHYAHVPKADFPFEQGFGVQTAVGGKADFRKLDHTGFSDIAFRGEYPIGLVEYRDPQSPVEVSLEAFSPFTPLDTADSSIPATVMQFTVKNAGKEKVDVTLVGWMQNPVCLYTAAKLPCRLQNKIVRKPAMTWLDCSASAMPDDKNKKPPVKRPDVVFEDFQKETYEGWAVVGTAFGAGPVLKSKMPKYQGDVGGRLPRVVNSHASAVGGPSDKGTGTLTSREFTIDRNYINLWIGGGKHPGRECVNLLIDGKVVASLTGENNNVMRRDEFNVRHLQGKKARLQIVDNETGPWGNIGVGAITFSDTPVIPPVQFGEQHDLGTIGLALLDPQTNDSANADGINANGQSGAAEMMKPSDQKLFGNLARHFSLEPGQSATAAFVVAWHFPNLNLGIGHLKSRGRYYTKRFAAAADVAEYVAADFKKLAGQTRLWRDTWYDSTLPYWFLDRTMANTSILASSTCMRFADGRFYAWEGVGCCEGTCTHVWHYAHAAGRLFPELERDLRQRTDFGTALHADTGVIEFRGEIEGLAVDGQAGCILRAYREHQMSPDAEFLKSLWPKIKTAMNCLVRMDKGDGLLSGPQHNTLDQPWFGKVAWLSSLYIAAARAAEAMALELGDAEYATAMRKIVERGLKSIDGELFNGEYYYQIADEAHKKSVGSHNGCEIDQVFGQSWAYQVGLGRILDEGNVKKALQSLWKYNFAPDVAAFRKKYKPGRWYAMPGEAGLIMCSWPRGDSMRVTTGFDFYFNECMNGFEHQVAWHMIAEGMVKEGLAIERALHDRYDASRRNPWNEVECGDHYARSMASYGVFVTATGYRYHGPKGFLAFAPKLSPEDFRAAFTAAEGWGTFSQHRDAASQTESIAIKYGKLRLRSLAFDVAAGFMPKSVAVAAGGVKVAAKHRLEGQTVVIDLADEATLDAGKTLDVTIG